MLKIVSLKICPFVQRVTALLDAKQIPYDVKYITLGDKPQWFLDISPNGQVPLLVTESGKALFESEAIIEYLEEAYPALQPERSFRGQGAGPGLELPGLKRLPASMRRYAQPDRSQSG